MLLDIVNDILDLSKIEAGGIALEKVHFDVNDKLEQVLATHRLIAQQKGIDFEYVPPKTPVPFLKGDPTRIGQIFANLISNAVKYTHDGFIRIAMSYDYNEEDYISLRFSVQDSGIGIPEDKQKLIFTKFTQADSSTTRKYGGTGLGLAITRQLVELMYGKIHVASEVGEGTTFSIIVPMEVVSEVGDDIAFLDVVDHTTGKNKKAIEKAKVLVAEDHDLNQVYMSRLLKKYGVEKYKIVENGALAFEETKNTQYDLIFMDCHMPEMNGFQATEAIREKEKQDSGSVERLPIVAMTANAMIGDRAKCIETGMDDYISKPIDLAEFERVLNRFFVVQPVKKKKPKSEKMAKVSNKKKTKVKNGEKDVVADLSNMIDLVGSDVKVLQNMVGVFIRQSDEIFSHLREKTAKKDSHEWSELAHKLKGGAVSVGSQKLAKLAEEAEKMSAETQKERQALLEKAEEEYKRLCEFLQKEVA
tara:strand:- start:397 stop:1818 length:1422 start_codon:yes stop_codon:yes gene_type:complete